MTIPKMIARAAFLGSAPDLAALEAAIAKAKEELRTMTSPPTPAAYARQCIEARSEANEELMRTIIAEWRAGRCMRLRVWNDEAQDFDKATVSSCSMPECVWVSVDRGGVILVTADDISGVLDDSQ